MVNEFLNNGYAVVNIFNNRDINHLKLLVSKKINKSLNYRSKKKIKFFPNNIKFYHNIIGNENLHKKVINNSKRYIHLQKENKKKIINHNIINKILKKYWGHNKIVIKWIGSLKKKEIKNNCCGFRLSRPVQKRKFDSAGAHCDINVGGRFSNDKKIMLTVWVPLEGFSKKYTLKLYRKSHLKLHSKNKIKKKIKSISRIFSKSYLKKYKSLRLDLKSGQAILIHPNLIHGGGENFGSKTRASIEVRLFNKINILKYPVNLSG